MDAKTITELDPMYSQPKQMPDGSWCCIGRFLYTYAIMCGIHECGYAKRYCFESELQARLALIEWNGVGDPPRNWIKEKPGNRLNPNWCRAA